MGRSVFKRRLRVKATGPDGQNVQAVDQVFESPIAQIVDFEMFQQEIGHQPVVIRGEEQVTGDRGWQEAPLVCHIFILSS